MWCDEVSYQPEVDYFPMTAHPQVSYSSYTTAVFEQLQFLFIKERPVSFLTNLNARVMLRNVQETMFTKAIS